MEERNATKDLVEAMARLLGMTIKSEGNKATIIAEGWPLRQVVTYEFEPYRDALRWLEGYSFGLEMGKRSTSGLSRIF